MQRRHLLFILFSLDYQVGNLNLAKGHIEPPRGSRRLTSEGLLALSPGKSRHGAASSNNERQAGDAIYVPYLLPRQWTTILGEIQIEKGILK